MNNAFQNLIFKKHNESYTWKIPSIGYDINEIKTAQHGQSFESPIFCIQSFECYCELFPNGCNDRTEGEIMLFLCIKSIPINIATIFSSYKLSLKERNTVITKMCSFTADKPWSNWKRGTLQLNKIQDLEQLTFEIIMNVERIHDLAGNVILNHDTDTNKENLMQQLLYQQHNYDEATEFLKQQLKMNNHIQFDPEAWFYEVGVQFYHIDKYKKCIECCLNAKSDGDELVLIGECYRYLGDHKKAIYYYKQYLLQYPDESTQIIDVLMEIGKVWYENGEYQKAIDHFSKCQSKKCPGDELLYIAISYHDMADNVNAIKYYEKYMEQYPNLPTDIMNVPLNLGVVYRNIGDFENAKKYFFKAIESYQGKDGALQHYTNILSDIENNHDEALAVSLQHFDECNPEHFNEIASIFRKMGNRSKSNEFWVKGLIKHNDDYSLNKCYGDYLGNIGKCQQSLYYYYKIYNLDKYRIDTLICIMTALAALNKIDQVIGIINKIQTLMKKEYENNVDYKFDRSSSKYSNVYYRRLYASKNVKIQMLTDLQYKVLDCLQSISTDYRNENELFENILNFIIKINEKYPDQKNIVKICKYLLYIKRNNEMYEMYEEMRKIFDYRALKTFSLYFYELKQYEKSIEISLNCLQTLNDKDMLNKHEYVCFYYVLCLNYSELNDHENYKKYHQLAMQIETKFEKFDEWNEYFKFDENDGKYTVFGDEINDIKYEFDEQSDNQFEEPSKELIDKYDRMISKLKTKENEFEKEFVDDEKKENKNLDDEVIKYNDNKEWEIINLWFDKATSISVHDMKWNELYIDCLLDLSKFNDATEYIEMFDLYDKLNDSAAYQIGKYYYYKEEKAKIALTYLNLLENGETESVLLVKARCYGKLKKYSKSIQLFNKILINDPFYVLVIENLCDVLIKRGNFIEARKLIYKALTIDHTHCGILNSFTNLLSRTLNGWKYSQIIYTKILNSKKNNFASFNNAGYTFYKFNKITNALDLAMQNVIRIKKNNSNLSTITVSNIGFYYYELYKKLKNKHGNNYDADKLRFYLDQSKKFMTFSLMIDEEADEPSEFAHYFYANLLFFELKKYNFAKLYYENALKIHENNKEELFDFFDIDYQQQCFLNYAKLLRILADYEKSNEYLDKAINFKIQQHKDSIFECNKPNFDKYNECYQFMSANYKDLGDDVNSKLWLQKINNNDT